MRIKLILLFLLMGLFSCGEDKKNTDLLYVSYNNLNRQEYADRLFIGDSHIAYHNWEGLYPGETVINAGVVGNSTAGIIEDIDSLPRQAAHIYLMVGINEMMVNIEQQVIVANYAEILSHLSTRGQVHCLLVMPVKAQYGSVNSVLPDLNNQLIQLCAAAGAIVHDTYSPVSVNGALPFEFSLDGIHLNLAGYWHIEPIIY